jgi:predicted negative regulator of RcsB-dependent stress response
MGKFRYWLRQNYLLVYFVVIGALVLLGWWLWS